MVFGSSAGRQTVLCTCLSSPDPSGTGQKRFSAQDRFVSNGAKNAHKQFWHLDDQDIRGESCMQGQLSGIEIEEGSDDTEEGVGFDRIGDFLRIIITNITL